MNNHVNIVYLLMDKVKLKWITGDRGSGWNLTAPSLDYETFALISEEFFKFMKIKGIKCSFPHMKLKNGGKNVMGKNSILFLSGSDYKVSDEWILFKNSNYLLKQPSVENSDDSSDFIDKPSETNIHPTLWEKIMWYLSLEWVKYPFYD